MRRKREAPEPSHAPIITRAKPEKMATVRCKSCHMALYMSDRVLHMPTWRCPSCGAITDPKNAAAEATAAQAE